MSVGFWAASTVVWASVDATVVTVVCDTTIVGSVAVRFSFVVGADTEDSGDRWLCSELSDSVVLGADVSCGKPGSVVSVDWTFCECDVSA